MLTTVAKVGKHKGVLWFTIMHQYPDYFQWAESVAMVVDKKAHYATMDAQWLKLVEKDNLKKSLHNGDK